MCLMLEFGTRLSLCFVTFCAVAKRSQHDDFTFLPSTHERIDTGYLQNYHMNILYLKQDVLDQ